MGPANTRQRFLLWLILGLSLGLRWSLCLSGGQYFFGDEARYDRGIRLYQAIAHHDWTDVRAVLALPEHALFPWLGALVTVLQHGLAQFTRFGDWSHSENILFTIQLGACVLSIGSVLVIWLVHRLALRAGATTTEALWAAGLMAASNTGLYYSRHLLQYDWAIAVALSAILIGLGESSLRRAFLSGLVAAAAYELYNGYWAALAIVPGLVALSSPSHRFRRLVVSGLGAASGLALAIATGLAAGGSNYLVVMGQFSRTVTQGVYAEGWSLPWAYLFWSEGVCGVVVVAITLAGVVNAARFGALEKRPKLWLWCAAGIYFLLVAFSVFIPKFVVYARIVKLLVPFLCLAAGWAFARLATGRRLIGLAAGGMLAISLLASFGDHVSRVFPREVEVTVMRQFGNPKRTLSVTGSIYQELMIPVKRPDLVLVNAQLLYPIRSVIGYPAGKPLLSIPNPILYRPFQYDGFTPRERDLIRSSDLSIRLIALANPAATPDNLPWAERYQNSDRPTGR